METLGDDGPCVGLADTVVGFTLVVGFIVVVGLPVVSFPVMGFPVMGLPVVGLPVVGLVVSVEFFWRACWNFWLNFQRIGHKTERSRDFNYTTIGTTVTLNSILYCQGHISL